MGVPCPLLEVLYFSGLMGVKTGRRVDISFVPGYHKQPDVGLKKMRWMVYD